METVGIRTQPFYQKAHKKKENQKTDNIQPTFVIFCLTRFNLRIIFYGIHGETPLSCVLIIYSEHAIPHNLKPFIVVYLRYKIQFLFCLLKRQYHDVNVYHQI